jgi:hypothetical protein
MASCFEGRAYIWVIEDAIIPEREGMKRGRRVEYKNEREKTTQRR